MPARKSVDEYVSGLDAPQRELVEVLRGLVRNTAPEATEAIKWGQPVFELQGPFAYVEPATRHVTFGFFRGAELDDSERLLEGTGKGMRHVKLASLDDLRERAPALRSLVGQAADLCRMLGAPPGRG